MTTQKLDPRTEEVQRILRSLTPAEKAAVEKMFEEEQQGKADTRRSLMLQVYEQEICPMDEFLFGKEYLAVPQSTLFPAIVDLILEIEKQDIREAFIVAGKGSGKSVLTSILMARALQRLLNVKDPSAYFGVMPGTFIAVVNMSISADQAENVLFNKLHSLLENSRYFNHPVKGKQYNKKKRHIEFPKNIHALSGHSGYRVYFGYDVFFGALDECAWYKDTEDHPVSEEIYQGIAGSATTRFPNDYKIVGITSPQAEDDFAFSRFTSIRSSGEEIKLKSQEI